MDNWGIIIQTGTKQTKNFSIYIYNIYKKNNCMICPFSIIQKLTDKSLTKQAKKMKGENTPHKIIT